MRQLAILTALMAACFAFEGKSGFSATELFTAADVPTGGVWADMDTIGLGWGGNDTGGDMEMAVDGDGDVFVIVHGLQNGGTLVTNSLARHDGTGLTHLCTAEPYDWSAIEGMKIRAVAMAPSGHPVILVQRVWSDAGTPVMAVDVVDVAPADPPALATLGTSVPTYDPLYTFAADPAGNVADANLAVASDGSIYVGPLRDGALVRLVAAANGDYSKDASYACSIDAGGQLAIDGNDNLYVFEKGVSLSSSDGTAREVFRVHPTTGAATSFGFINGNTFVYGWAGDADGKLWVGLRDTGRKAKRYVVEVKPGATTRNRDRISESSHDPHAVAAGPNGTLVVMEWISSGDALHLLTPGSGDAGGGGKGNGKGKK